VAGQLAGKVGIVTGGGSGIGRATALAMAREGAKLTIADVNDLGGRETVKAIQELGGEALFIHADMASASDVVAMVERTVSAYGKLDCAFNNAGIFADGGTRIADLDDAIWNQVIAVNLTGVYLCIKHEIPAMLANGGGVIVNTASTVGLAAQSDSPAYVASKHGVVGLTRSTALEYGRQGIRANAVCPGMTHTEMWEQGQRALDPAEAAARQAKVDGDSPMRRMGRPEEMGDAVVWLCSDAASYVNGHALVVDGGDLAAWRTNYWS
jgi:NAD(P)-dependent dehydrogenase (short-subunit alcohol dehydrogenase family)